MKQIPYEIQASDISIRNKDQKIPYTIIQTMKTNNVTYNMYNAVMSWINKNPEYDYIFFDDERCKQFLKDEYGEEYLHIFNMLGNGATKADFFRWCYLYKKGGIYLDIDMVCIKPLREYITDDLSFVSRKKSFQKNNYVKLSYEKNHTDFIVNNKRLSDNTQASRINHTILAVIPHIEILQKAIESAYQNIMDCYKYKQNYKYPFYLCGPGLLGVTFNKILNRHDYLTLENINEGYFLDEKNKFKLLTDEKARTLFNPKYKNYKKDYKNITNSKSYWNSLAFDYKKASEYVIKNNITI